MLHKIKIAPVRRIEPHIVPVVNRHRLPRLRDPVVPQRREVEHLGRASRPPGPESSSGGRTPAQGGGGGRRITPSVRCLGGGDRRPRPHLPSFDGTPPRRTPSPRGTAHRRAGRL